MNNEYYLTLSHKNDAKIAINFGFAKTFEGKTRIRTKIAGVFGQNAISFCQSLNGTDCGLRVA